MKNYNKHIFKDDVEDILMNFLDKMFEEERKYIHEKDIFNVIKSEARNKLLDLIDSAHEDGANR